MRDSVKKFLEFMSSQSEEIKERAGKMSMAELAAHVRKTVEDGLHQSSK
jgi:hypothetical protein